MPAPPAPAPGIHGGRLEQLTGRLEELGGRLEDLACRLEDQLEVRPAAVLPERREPLVDAQEVARMLGRTREWVYDHQGELGAIRLGSGPKPRLVFDPSAVLANFERANGPAPVTPPPIAAPHRGRRSPAGRTASGAPLLRVRGHESR